ncbi:MAG TPA: hypothetical protein VLT33_48505 [Labilithrix sp.]|nr:hypothetical protein [Labilithrix sp.]
MSGRALGLAALLLALASVGCSWLLGVSEDPVVDAPAADAGDEDAAPE